MTPLGALWAMWGVRHVQMLMIFLCFVEAYILVSGLSVAVVVMSDEDHLDWPDSGQSLVLSAFLWGFFASPMAGGQLAHMMGAKRMMLLSILLSSIASILLPVAAGQSGWQATCAVRVAQGLFQGVLAPGAHALLAQWAPPVERARLGSFVYGGAQLGTMFGLLLGGFLTDSSWGWPSVFYVSGALGLIWCLAWFFLGSNSPMEHRGISKSERDFIEMSLSSLSNTEVVSTPWRQILMSPAVWGLTAAHCGQMVGYWTLLTQLPSYMKNVQGFDTSQNGLVTALPYFAMWVAALPLSWVSDVLVKSGRASTTVMRKIANTIAQWGGGMVLIALGFGVADTDSTLTVVLLTVAMTLLASMYLGFQINHLDISPNHAPALMGFTNLWANLLSVLGPIITPLVVTDKTSASQWHIVFLAAGGLFLVANLLFVVFGSGVVQPWNELGLAVASPESGITKPDFPTDSNGGGDGISTCGGLFDPSQHFSKTCAAQDSSRQGMRKI